MAKQSKSAKKSKKPQERILGIAVKGTTKGNILEELVDGKEHSIDSLKECRVQESDSVGWRLSMLKAAGHHAERPFKLDIGEEKVRLSFLKNGKAPKKVEKKAKSGSSKPKASQRASVQDVPVAE